MITVGDSVSILQWLSQLVAARANNADDEEIKHLRVALSHLYFSEKTISALLNLNTNDVGRVAISQRDNRNFVGDALSTLARLNQNARMSIRSRRLMESIMHSKTTIRLEIAYCLHKALQSGNREEVDQLVRSIRGLNSQIEELDNLIGGILM